MASFGQQRQMNSILAIDFGSVNTRVVLIDLVNGQYRLVTRTQTSTTVAPPISDVTIGLSRAIENLQESVQRRFIDSEGLLILPEDEGGNGIDQLVATSSASRPLNAVLVGLMPEISIRSALHALTGTYINVSATLSIADQEDEETQINKILKSKPDVVFISGGTDGGNVDAVLDLIRLVSLAVKLVHDDERPIVIYAGNQDLAETVRRTFADTDTHVHIANNIRPSLNEEDLGAVRLYLARGYNDFMAQQEAGFDAVAGYTHTGVVPTAQSISNVVRWLGELPQQRKGILHLDVGSSTSTLVTSLRQEVNARIHSDMGVGHSILSTVEQIDSGRVSGWLPFPFSEDDLMDYAYNKALLPESIPETEREMLIEQAIGREIVHTLMAEADDLISYYSPLIVSGAVFCETPHPGITAMLIIDAFEVEGIVDLYVDRFAIVPALGAIAYINSQATVQVFENQGVTSLGAAFCATGRPRAQGRRPAMRIAITLASGRVINKELMPGEIWAAPLSPGQQATVDVRLGRGLKIDGRRRVKKQVVSGTAGLVFDARGRPLNFVPLKQRPEMLNMWWQSLTDNTLQFKRVKAFNQAIEEAESGSEDENYQDRMVRIGEVQAFIQGAQHGEGRPTELGKKDSKKRRGRNKKQRGKKGKQDEDQEEASVDDLLSRFG